MNSSAVVPSAPTRGAHETEVARGSRATAARDEPTLLRWLLPLAVLHGLLFVVLVPPWQHYDEPAHFLYAAEVAAGEVAGPGPASATLRREIADSMYRHRFYEPGVRPDVLALVPPEVGVSQRGHPPLYYTLVAVALRPFAAMSVEAQLYLARGVSLILYAFTVLAAWRIAVALAPDEPLIQLAIPLLTLLVPTFADIMSAVNNDVLLNFSLTVALLGAVLLVRDGMRPLPLALLLLGAAVALMTKRTGLVAVPPLLLALAWAVWRAPGRWWVLPLFAAGVALVALSALELRTIPGPDGPMTVLAVRPWLDALGSNYLRLSLDTLVRSLTDPSLVGDRYWVLLQVGFSGYYTQFAWGHLALHPAWAIALAGLSLVSLVGLIVGGVRTGSALPLWQQRSLWVFLVSLVAAWVSVFLRLHPLPPLDQPVYIPRARYMFWAIVPNLWLFALGLSWATPERWRRQAIMGLIGFFVCLNLAAWLWAITAFYYR